jgi:hypothetical protein
LFRERLLDALGKTGGCVAKAKMAGKKIQH